MIGEITFYSEVWDRAGAVKQSETVFSIGDSITCTKEVKIFAPPPRYYTSEPKVMRQIVERSFSPHDVVALCNEWIEKPNYPNLMNGKRYVVYLKEKEN